MSSLRGHRRGHMKFRRYCVYSLCSPNAVFGWNQGKRSMYGGPEWGGWRTEGRTVCEVQSPPPRLTGCWKQGAPRRSSVTLIGRTVPGTESLCSSEEGRGKWKNPNRRFWLIHTVGIHFLHLVSARHKTNISRIKNKYVGPSLGNISPQIQPNWIKMRYFTVEMDHSVRYEITLQKWKYLMAGYYNIITFEENSKTRNCPPFIKGFHLKEQLEEL